MERINFANIPGAMTSRPNWIVWRTEQSDRDKPTKIPYSVGGLKAKSNDPSTWSVIEAAKLAYDLGGYDGIGYMFGDDDNLCGIDLDGCRDPITGAVADWARDIIVRCGTYAEVSPTKTGVKLFGIGKNPFATGKKTAVDFPAITDKTPAIEIYNRVRYFAVTGWTLRGLTEPKPCQEAIDWIKATYWPPLPPPPPVDFRSQSSVVERARRYIAKAPPSVSGSGGHNAAFYVACVLVMGFGLSSDESLGLMREWNQACQPPWSERELQHKVSQAEKQPGERNYLRDVQPTQWSTVNVPSYASPPPPATTTARVSTMKQAVATYVDMIRKGETVQAETGIPDIDEALGGGITPGEIIVMAARPSHGKSAVALQIVHYWTACGKPCLVISEEMSHKALGKRTLQFSSDVPREHWKASLTELDRDVAEYAEDRAECIIVESCGTAAEAVNQIDAAVASHNIELAVVDYAQLLKSPGGSVYEQVTNTCKALVAAAKRHGITLIMLCQLNREIEKRKKFIPVMSDLKESGQFEQDADVILFLVWPHRLDAKLPANEYFVFVAKNRDGEIVNPIVKCRFDPSRQSLRQESWKERAQSHDNYSTNFDDWNDGK